MGGNRGRAVTAVDKAQAIELIEEARQSGAGQEAACDLIGITVRTLQRWKSDINNLEDKRNGPLTEPANKLLDAERDLILQTCCSPKYCDMPPCQIVAALADTGIFMGSESTFYRVLKAASLAKARASSKPYTHHKPEELVASGIKQVWCWDITLIPTFIRNAYIYLHTFIDLFSRKIVGWGAFTEQTAETAVEVLKKAAIAEQISYGTLTLHSDNGCQMKSILMLATMKALGITPSFSRPSVSDDNPFIEAFFRTLKYCPQFPIQAFESLGAFITWMIVFALKYNTVDKHSGIKYVTPHERHEGLDIAILKKRAAVYEEARAKNPNRWSRAIKDFDWIELVYLNPKHSKSERKRLVLVQMKKNAEALLTT